MEMEMEEEEVRARRTAYRRLRRGASAPRVFYGRVGMLLLREGGPGEERGQFVHKLCPRRTRERGVQCLSRRRMGCCCCCLLPGGSNLLLRGHRRFLWQAI